MDYLAKDELTRLLERGLNRRTHAVLKKRPHPGPYEGIDRIATGEEIVNAIEGAGQYKAHIFWGWNNGLQSTREAKAAASVMIPLPDTGEMTLWVRHVVQEYLQFLERRVYPKWEFLKEPGADFRSFFDLGYPDKAQTLYPRATKRKEERQGEIGYVLGHGNSIYWLGDRVTQDEFPDFGAAFFITNVSYLELAMLTPLARVADHCINEYKEMLRWRLDGIRSRVLGEEKAEETTQTLEQAFSFTVGQSEHKQHFNPKLIDYSKPEIVHPMDKITLDRVIGSCYDGIKDLLYHRFVLARKNQAQVMEYYQERPDILPERPSSAMLIGEPGVGKTMLGKMVACELGIPYIEIAADDITSTWLAQSQQLARAIFKAARSQPNGVVLALDDFDLLLPSRDGKKSHSHQDYLAVLQVIMQELDASRNHDNKVITFMTTNVESIDEVDKAVVNRIGTADPQMGIYEVHMPDVGSLGEIIHFYAPHLSLDESIELAGYLDEPVPRTAMKFVSEGIFWKSSKLKKGDEFIPPTLIEYKDLLEQLRKEDTDYRELESIWPFIAANRTSRAHEREEIDLPEKKIIVST